MEKKMKHPAHRSRRRLNERSLFLLALLLGATCVTYAQQGTSTGAAKMSISLNAGWQFHEVGKTDWHPATVPGCVHTDLLTDRLIDDPFYRDNEKKLQWIGKTDWEYQTTFNVTAEMLKHSNLELILEGLDTYANVFLNDESLISTDNMFRTWRVNIKRLAKPGTNTLRI